MEAVPTKLGYYSFPLYQTAQATGRGPSSLMFEDRGVRFRHYGRTVHEYMLMDWLDEQFVKPALQELRDAGAKLKSVNFTLPVPKGIIPLRGPTEFRIPGNWSPGEGRSAKTRATLRRACRGLTARQASWASLVDQEICSAVLVSWEAWAGERHFMLFRGMYRRWLELFFLGLSFPPRPSESYLYVIEREGVAVGIFGGEQDAATGEAVVTLAKHTPELDGKAMWCLGLEAMLREFTPTMVHCGSTADKLKLDLGFIPHPSWIPDLKALS